MKVRLSKFANGYIGAEELRDWLAALPDYGFDVWVEAIESEAHRSPRIVVPFSERAREDAREKRPVKCDRLTEARDKWVYNECCKGTAYDSIARKLPKKNANWEIIETKQGILACAKRYAKRHESA